VTDARAIVYERFAATGAPPSAGEAAAALETSADAVLDAWRALHDAHQLVLNATGDAVRMAHPFSAAPMGFVVRRGDRLWWGGCAWDSFGIAAALGEELEIETRCPGCGTELRYVAGPETAPPDLTVRLPRPAAEWWEDVVATCTHIRMFCSPDHAPGGGALVPAETMWRLALPWYGNRLDADYVPLSADRKRELLAGLGLDGPFWQLP
jgi:hypothetical protein